MLLRYWEYVSKLQTSVTDPTPSGSRAIASRTRERALTEAELAAAMEGFGVLALQIEAGGVGINLQCAQVVILMEPQFKPSTERQAIARVRRMGQTRKVNAHRLIAKGTVDEALVLLIDRKKQVFEDYAQHSSVKDASGMAIDAGGAAMEELRRAVGAGS